jgi:carbon storage regulator
MIVKPMKEIPTMLVLRRKPQESIRIAEGIVVTVLAVDGERVNVGIEAPSDITIVRGELCQDTRKRTDAVPRTSTARR